MVNFRSGVSCTLLALATSFTTISCEEQEYIGPEQLLVTLASLHFYSCAANARLVVTDFRERILAVKNVGGGVEMPIYGPLPPGEGTVNLYFIDADDNHYRVAGFRDIKRGTLFSGIVDEGRSTPIRQLNINTENIPSFERLTFSSDNQSRTLSNHMQSPGSFTLGSSADQLFMQLVERGEGRYGFFSLANCTGDVIPDYKQINEKSQRHQLTVGAKMMSPWTVIQGAVSEQDPVSKSYGIYEGADTDFFIPENTFARFYTTLRYRIGDVNFTDARSDDRPNFNFEPIDIAAEVVSADPTNFRMNVSGQFDYYNLYYTNANSSIEMNMFGCNRATAFSLPDFSQVKGLGRLRTESLLSYGITLYNLAGHVEDQPYFKYYSEANPKAVFDSQRAVIVGDL